MNSDLPAHEVSNSLRSQRHRNRQTGGLPPTTLKRPGQWLARASLTFPILLILSNAGRDFAGKSC